MQNCVVSFCGKVNVSASTELQNNNIFSRTLV